MPHIHYQQARYLTSATTLKQLPPDVGAEVAFVGRSNAGKSSAINTITHINGLAKTSRSPGRTQMLNFFVLDDTHRLVDLPGYGFAKAPQDVKARWERLTAEYLEVRESLRGLVLVMDVRHPLKDMDQQLIDWCMNFNVPLHILLTKADKLKTSAQKQALLTVQSALAAYEDLVTIQLFSSLKRMGVDSARAQLNTWFSSHAGNYSATNT